VGEFGEGAAEIDKSNRILGCDKLGVRIADLAPSQRDLFRNATSPGQVMFPGWAEIKIYAQSPDVPERLRFGKPAQPKTRFSAHNDQNT
jgi:hypothetical protein